MIHCVTTMAQKGGAASVNPPAWATALNNSGPDRCAAGKRSAKAMRHPATPNATSRNTSTAVSAWPEPPQVAPAAPPTACPSRIEKPMGIATMHITRRRNCSMISMGWSAPCFSPMSKASMKPPGMAA